MPGIFIWGVSKDTSQEVLDELEIIIKWATSRVLVCPEDWVDVYYPADLSNKKRNVWVLADTGLFETKPWAEAEKMAKELTVLLCPAIHQALGLGPDQKVEAFPVPLLLHLHSIYPGK